MFLEFHCEVSGTKMAQSSTLYEDISDIISDDHVITAEVEVEISDFAKKRLDTRQMKRLISSSDRYQNEWIICLRVHYFSRELKAIIFQKVAKTGYKLVSVAYASGKEQYYFSQG